MINTKPKTMNKQNEIKTHLTIESATNEYNLLKKDFSTSWIAFDASTSKYQVMIFPYWMLKGNLLIKKIEIN
jgi:hypothetical protein